MGNSYRAMVLVLIDKEGVVISRTVSDLPIGFGTKPVDTANADGNNIAATHNVTNNLDKTGGD